MKTKMNLMLVLAALLIISCQSSQKNPFDREAETKKILALDELDNQVLLKADVNLIRKLDKCAPDSTVALMQGELMWNKNSRFMSDEEIISGYGFKQMKYTQIKQLNEPIINFSPDGKMAYEAGRQIYTYEIVDSLGSKRTREFILAYLGIWEKRDTCWGLAALSQTFNYNPGK